MTARLAGVGAVVRVFKDVEGRADYISEISSWLIDFVSESRLFEDEYVDEAADYLFAELTTGGQFAVGAVAHRLADEFRTHLKRNNFDTAFGESVDAVHRDAASCFGLLRNWVQAFVATQDDAKLTDYVDEIALILMPGKPDGKQFIDGQVDDELPGIVGSHPVIDGGTYHLNYNRFTHRIDHFSRVIVPRFNEYVELKRDIVDSHREEMRLDEFRQRVLTSLVRNRLLNEVYLPLIGDNLAKQIGSAGEGKRTDLMGLLLLVSPPGYGKTTLM